MPSILIATGHDVAPESMEPFVIQPQTVGLIPTRRSLAISGRVLDEAEYWPLTWPLFETEANYRAILTQCGLLTAKTALVSVQIEDENYDVIVRNATAIKPQIGTDGGRSDMFLKGVTILLTRLLVQA
jgi:hypothetical protein